MIPTFCFHVWLLKRRTENLNLLLHIFQYYLRTPSHNWSLDICASLDASVMVTIQTALVTVGVDTARLLLSSTDARIK
jgi:hypothetical protein